MWRVEVGGEGWVVEGWGGWRVGEVERVEEMERVEEERRARGWGKVEVDLG